MTDKLEKVSEEDLQKITGGISGKVGMWDGPLKRVSHLSSHTLALRTEPVYRRNNEIDQLNEGDEVQITGAELNGYVWVWAPTLKSSGWVNAKFLDSVD